MFTQAIKRWLNTLLGWWPWKKTTEQEYAQSERPLNKGVTQESMLWSGSDGVTPHSGAAPLIIGQGETSQTSLSTIDEWPERIVQAPPPSPTPPAPEFDKVDLSLPPPLLPTPPPIDAPVAAVESIPGDGETVFDTPPTTPEHKLEFLHYLIRHGIVNEGFLPGQVPEQYKQ